MSKLFLLMFLCSCASGLNEDLTPTQQTVDPTPKAPRQLPPVEEKEPEPKPIIKCVIDDYWVGNCYVVNIYCQDKPVQVEVSCAGEQLFPWKDLPYPPDYNPAFKISKH